MITVPPRTINRQDTRGLYWQQRGLRDLATWYGPEPDIDIIRHISASRLGWSFSDTIVHRLDNKPAEESEESYYPHTSLHRLYTISHVPLEGNTDDDSTALTSSSFSEYVFRVALPADPYIKTLSEVATMQLIKQYCPSIPVPSVYAWSAIVKGDEIPPQEDLGFEWILMEKMPGEELTEHWEVKMDLKEKAEITMQLARMSGEMKRIISNRIGSCYHRDLVVRTPTPRRKDSTVTIVDLPLRQTDHAVTLPDAYVVGPGIEPNFYFQNRNLSDTFRGPFSKTRDYVATIVDAHDASHWLQHHHAMWYLFGDQDETLMGSLGLPSSDFVKDGPENVDLLVQDLCCEMNEEMASKFVGNRERAIELKEDHVEKIAQLFSDEPENSVWTITSEIPDLNLPCSPLISEHAFGIEEPLSTVTNSATFPFESSTSTSTPLNGTVVVEESCMIPPPSPTFSQGDFAVIPGNDVFHLSRSNLRLSDILYCPITKRITGMLNFGDVMFKPQWMPPHKDRYPYPDFYRGDDFWPSAPALESYGEEEDYFYRRRRLKREAWRLRPVFLEGFEDYALQTETLVEVTDKGTAIVEGMIDLSTWQGEMQEGRNRTSKIQFVNALTCLSTGY